MVQLDAAVEHGDEHAVAVRLRPRLRGAGRLVRQAPLVVEHRVRGALGRSGRDADRDGDPEGGE